ncbi:MAG: RusA family crossover junction endodeoxyribonuclease [Ruminococcus sp.]|nr:RusA family crossover junction endodeoxyribonuclease [Ruminococcus sp.]MDE7225569.1 RusA family crossover junction endodeoxyribonuclease [Ruminococcus sp.]
MLVSNQKVKFTVHGEPVGKQRPKFSRRGNHVHTYTPDKTVNYENLIRLEYSSQCGDFSFPKDTGIRMNIEAYFSIPKSASRKKSALMLDKQIRPTKKPDSDNIIKIIADSLNGIAYHDDSQIVSCMFDKYYGSQACVTVSICEADDS